MWDPAPLITRQQGWLMTTFLIFQSVHQPTTQYEITNIIIQYENLNINCKLYKTGKLYV